MRMPLVTFKGYLLAPGNVNSTKNAVHPASGAATRATHVFGPEGVREDGLYAGPIASRRKLRAAGFVACQSCTSLGSWRLTTLIDPSRSNVHFTSGRGVLLTIAA